VSRICQIPRCARNDKNYLWKTYLGKAYLLRDMARWKSSAVVS
jgi:hypothetical protein